MTLSLEAGLFVYRLMCSARVSQPSPVTALPPSQPCPPAHLPPVHLPLWTAQAGRQEMSPHFTHCWILGSHKGYRTTCFVSQVEKSKPTGQRSLALGRPGAYRAGLRGAPQASAAPGSGHSPTLTPSGLPAAPGAQGGAKRPGG